MTPKQLGNILALARLGLTAIAQDQQRSAEHIHELSGDMLAGHRALAEMQAKAAEQPVAP